MGRESFYGIQDETAVWEAIEWTVNYLEDWAKVTFYPGELPHPIGARDPLQVPSFRINSKELGALPYLVRACVFDHQLQRFCPTLLNNLHMAFPFDVNKDAIQSLRKGWEPHETSYYVPPGKFNAFREEVEFQRRKRKLVFGKGKSTPVRLTPYYHLEQEPIDYSFFFRNTSLLQDPKIDPTNTPPLFYIGIHTKGELYIKEKLLRAWFAKFQKKHQSPKYKKQLVD